MEVLLRSVELVYYIVAIIAFISIFFTIFSYFVMQRQLYASTVSRCIDIYRNDFFDLSSEVDRKLCEKYVDFVNEELFYLENRFLPDVVGEEWIDGMIDLIPVYVNNRIVNQNCALTIISEKKLLHSYPRIKKAFVVKKDYDFDKIFSKKDGSELSESEDGRIMLCKEILANIKGRTNFWDKIINCTFKKNL